MRSPMVAEHANAFKFFFVQHFSESEARLQKQKFEWDEWFFPNGNKGARMVGEGKYFQYVKNIAFRAPYETSNKGHRNS